MVRRNRTRLERLEKKLDPRPGVPIVILHETDGVYTLGDEKVDFGSYEQRAESDDILLIVVSHVDGMTSSTLGGCRTPGRVLPIHPF